jgi:hypothetical protein
MRFLQITALAALAAVRFPCPAADQSMAPGSPVSRWSIKTSLPSGADLTKPGILIALPAFLELKPAAEDRTAAFQDKRYPKVEGAPAGEGDIVRTQGYVRLVAQEPDGDFHIQISVQPDNFDNCLVVEVPNADPKFVTNSPPVLDAAKTVRDLVIAKLLAGKTPSPGSVHVIAGPAYVEVSGQLFFDSEHQAAMAKGVYRGKSIGGKQLPSKTSWEIHPITGMKFVTRPSTP